MRRDVYAQKGASYDFPIYTRDGAIDSSLALSRTLSQVPTFSIDRVYVSMGVRDQAERWLRENRDSIISSAVREEHRNGTPSES